MINEWNKDGPTVNEEVPGDEWYEREKAAFIAWWESEGQKKFGETPTLAAGARWLARAEAVRSETACRDSARLNLLAEITNLVALEEAGAMLTGDQKKLVRRVGEALSSKYELHRRTNDTPEAFRRALDEAMKEVGHGR